MTANIYGLIQDPTTLFVINHSGGKDSQAMMIRLLRIIPRGRLVVVHAALGEVEWPGALELAERQASDAGIPFVVARSVKTFFEMVEHRFTVRPGPNSPCWPSAKNRQCTSDLKRGPIQREVRRFMKENGFVNVVSCLGIRSQESKARAKQPAFQRNDSGCTRTREWFEWHPISELTRDEVFAIIAAAGQTPHPAYAAGNDRLSCVFCIMGSPGDIQNGARQNPDLLRKLVHIERRTGYTMHQSRIPLDVIAGVEVE